MPDLLDLRSYDYQLPPELIAQFPLSERSACRLLRLDRTSGAVTHHRFHDLVELLSPGDLLVLNRSKVIPARLYGRKSTGGQIEVLLLRQLGDAGWQCMVQPGRRLRTEQWLEFSPRLRGWLSLPDGEGLRELEFESPDNYWEEVERLGHVPLPPYIKRSDEPSDRENYQTVYALEPGSVAAPTAGLHFDEKLLKALQQRGIRSCSLILHVGMGTFKPVSSARIDGHKMHREFFTIPAQTAEAVNAAKEEGRRVVAVGTTAVRALESSWSQGRLQEGSRWTEIFIYPGRELRVPDALITNFHLPKSTLLMMISAFAGLEPVRRAYEEAIRMRYRFFSYGDAMLIT